MQILTEQVDNVVQVISKWIMVNARKNVNREKISDCQETK